MWLAAGRLGLTRGRRRTISRAPPPRLAPGPRGRLLPYWRGRSLWRPRPWRKRCSSGRAGAARGGRGPAASRGSRRRCMTRAPAAFGTSGAAARRGGGWSVRRAHRAAVCFGPESAGVILFAPSASPRPGHATERAAVAAVYRSDLSRAGMSTLAGRPATRMCTPDHPFTRIPRHLRRHITWKLTAPERATPTR